MNRDGQAPSCHSYTRLWRPPHDSHAAFLLFPSRSCKVRLCHLLLTPFHSQFLAYLPRPSLVSKLFSFATHFACSKRSSHIHPCSPLATPSSPPCHPHASPTPPHATPSFRESLLESTPCKSIISMIRTPAHSHATPVRIAAGLSWDYRRVEATPSSSNNTHSERDPKAPPR